MRYESHNLEMTKSNNILRQSPIFLQRIPQIARKISGLPPLAGQWVRGWRSEAKGKESPMTEKGPSLLLTLSPSFDRSIGLIG